MTDWRRLVMVLVVPGVASACSSAPPPEPPPPAPPPVEAPPPLPMLAPSAVAGQYQLRVALEGRPPGQGGGSARPPAATTLRLDNQPAAVPMPGPSTQFNAIIHVPGYTRPPRGRAGQAAAWWPSPGDSVVIQFTPAQPGAQIQLRGVLTASGQRAELAGEVWYVSLESGSTFQVGTFSAARNPPRRRGR